MTGYVIIATLILGAFAVREWYLERRHEAEQRRLDAEHQKRMYEMKREHVRRMRALYRGEDPNDAD